VMSAAIADVAIERPTPMPIRVLKSFFMFCLRCWN
jgi:hypothetical protein